MARKTVDLKELNLIFIEIDEEIEKCINHLPLDQIRQSELNAMIQQTRLAVLKKHGIEIDI